APRGAAHGEPPQPLSPLLPPCLLLFQAPPLHDQINPAIGIDRNPRGSYRRSARLKRTTLMRSGLPAAARFGPQFLQARPDAAAAALGEVREVRDGGIGGPAVGGEPPGGLATRKGEFGHRA